MPGIISILFKHIGNQEKDKDSIRLLFDGRLLNYDTIREPMAMISKPEILAHLVNKTHLTSLDFSDAFFTYH